jgi:acyl-CoA thioesterase I
VISVRAPPKLRRGVGLASEPARSGRRQRTGGRAGPAPITRTVADRRILFFGDSLVAGAGDPSGLGWVGRLVAASFAAGAPVTAYNLGVRGETSVQVGSRWRQETGPRLVPGADTRIVLSFGANDATSDGGKPRVEAERSCDALVSILDRARTIDLPALVVGPAAVEDAEHNQRIHSLSVAFASVCTERGAPFVSVIEPLLASTVWMDDVAAGDGAHPGAAGYDALARRVLDGGWLDWLRASPT